MSKLTGGSFNLLIKDDNVYTATSMKIKLKCIWNHKTAHYANMNPLLEHRINQQHES